MSRQRTFTTREFAELVGREVRTLYKWSREGKLVPKKDFNNRNIYTEEDYKRVMGIPYKPKEQEQGV